VIQTPLTKALRGAGLSGYEIRCYLSLLERDALTPPEVAKVAGIARPSAYDALEKLMSRGLCISKPGDVKKYSACEPALLREKLLMELDEAAQAKLEDLRTKEEEILEKTRTVKERVSKAIEELKPQYENSRLDVSPLDYIEIIKDPYQISKRFMQLVEATKEELLGFIKPPYSATKETIIEQIKQQIRLIKEGLKIRAVWEIPKDKEMIRWLDAYLREAAEYGDQMRVIEELPLKMAIFDSRIVIFTLEDPVSWEISVTTQIVEHRALARTLKVIFETLWEQAQDYQILGDSRR
jgi:sugar-specific transcriptional regulator TrmB